ncbi:MAG: hypothetical protein HQ507_10915 [Candidatus Marinimicrobia bacterium]|nr:hypothetical protein [Candidatus Neomarinimicrobiota bacterium]
MRPDNSNKLDVVDALLENTWENLPAHLERHLLAIPSQIDFAQNHRFDRLSLFLNTILILWAAGMLMYFWTPLEGMLANLAQGLMGFSAFSPQLLAHPIVALIAMACLLFGWVWMDTEKPPGLKKV